MDKLYRAVRRDTPTFQLALRLLDKHNGDLSAAYADAWHQMQKLYRDLDSGIKTPDHPECDFLCWMEEANGFMAHVRPKPIE